jgi:hypothetical protein
MGPDFKQRRAYFDGTGSALLFQLIHLQVRVYPRGPIAAVEAAATTSPTLALNCSNWLSLVPFFTERQDGSSRTFWQVMQAAKAASVMPIWFAPGPTYCCSARMPAGNAMQCAALGARLAGSFACSCWAVRQHEGGGRGRKGGTEEGRKEGGLLGCGLRVAQR